MSILIGLLIGLILGLTGSGGAILAVPLLIYLLHLHPSQAIGMSLGVVASSALLGVIRNINKDRIQWLPAVVFAAIGSAFTPLGHSINKQLPETTILLCFSVVVILVAITMWKRSYQPDTIDLPTNAGLCPPEFKAAGKLGHRCLMGIFVGAAVTGTLSGLFGVGGGFIIIPTLTLLLGIGMQKAIATSLFIICVVSTAGFINYVLSSPVIDLILLAKIIAGGSIGMLIGQHYSQRLSGPKLQRSFVIIMLAVALFMIGKTFL